MLAPLQTEARCAFALLFFPYLAFALLESIGDRRSSRNLRGFIRQTLSQVGVILLDDVEHRLLGEPAVILGKQLMHVCEILLNHGKSPCGKCQIISRQMRRFRTMRSDG